MIVVVVVVEGRSAVSRRLHQTGEKHAEESHGHGERRWRRWRRWEAEQRRLQRRLAANQRRVVRQHPRAPGRRPVSGGSQARRRGGAFRRARHSDLAGRGFGIGRGRRGRFSFEREEGVAEAEGDFTGAHPRGGHPPLQTDHHARPLMHPIKSSIKSSFSNRFGFSSSSVGFVSFCFFGFFFFFVFSCIASTVYIYISKRWIMNRYFYVCMTRSI